MQLKAAFIWTMIALGSSVLWGQSSIVHSGPQDREKRRAEYVSLIHSKFASTVQKLDVVDQRNFENRKNEYARMTPEDWRQLKIDFEMSILHPMESMTLSNPNFSTRTPLDREFYGMFRYGPIDQPHSRIHLLSLMEDYKTHRDLNLPNFGYNPIEMEGRVDNLISAGQKTVDHESKLFIHVNRLFNAIQDRYLGATAGPRAQCDEAKQMRDFLTMAHYAYDRERGDIESVYEYPTASRSQALQELDLSFNKNFCKSDERYPEGRYAFALSLLERCSLPYEIPQILAYCSGRPDQISLRVGGEISSVEDSCREIPSQGQETVQRASDAAKMHQIRDQAQTYVLKNYLSGIHQSEDTVKRSCGSMIFDCDRNSFKGTEDCIRWHRGYCGEVQEALKIVSRNQPLQNAEREALEEWKRAHRTTLPPASSERFIHETGLETLSRTIRGEEPGHNVIPYKYGH